MKTVRRSRSWSRSSRNQIRRMMGQRIRGAVSRVRRGTGGEAGSLRPAVGVSESISPDAAARPVQHQEPLEMVVAADVVPLNRTQAVLAVAVRVAAEDEGH